MSKKDAGRNRYLFAGGGTGGHLFPAVAVANEIKNMKPDSEILFVGTKRKIEARVVPSLGYKFKSIWISGVSRNFNLNNLLFPGKLVVSIFQSLYISMKFKPSVAIGSGGYVAGPSIWSSSVMGAKIILLEQNSYPGITTRLLEKYADEIHISFSDSRKYLRKKELIKETGNPVRDNLGTIERTKAIKSFNLSEKKKTLLVLGGSLGARSINNAVTKMINKNEQLDFQIIWQTGSLYYNEFKELESGNVKVYEFIEDMNQAYSASDLLLARAGATTIAEILVMGKPAILVPSPNVAANHQFHNANSLSEKNAAVLVKDEELESEIFNKVNLLINNDEVLKTLSINAKELSKPGAAKEIALSAIKMANEQ